MTAQRHLFNAIMKRILWSIPWNLFNWYLHLTGWYGLWGEKLAYFDTRPFGKIEMKIFFYLIVRGAVPDDTFLLNGGNKWS